ncbi:hypothetical protein GCM10027416_01110 [Okibacterium endophyticum]
MEHRHDVDQSGSTEHSQLRRERNAQERLLNLGADSLAPRPWRPDPTPPTAVDLTQFALWKSADLAADDLLSALALLPAARSEVEGMEIGLIFSARTAGLTWAQIAEAMGFHSPQACQQYVTRLNTRRSERL